MQKVTLSLQLQTPAVLLVTNIIEYKINLQLQYYESCAYQVRCYRSAQIDSTDTVNFVAVYSLLWVSFLPSSLWKASSPQCTHSLTDFFCWQPHLCPLIRQHYYQVRLRGEIPDEMYSLLQLKPFCWQQSPGESRWNQSVSQSLGRGASCRWSSTNMPHNETLCF